MEFRIGKCKEIYKDKETSKEKILSLINEKHLELWKDFSITEEDLDDKCPWLDSEKYFTAVKPDGKTALFEIITDRDIEDEENDICEVEKEGEDTYSYKLRYYNGGTDFSEMFQEGLKKLIIKIL